jgi:hypothetical protein
MQREETLTNPPVAEYHADVFAWAQHQAGRLRSLAGSGLPLPNELDLERVAKEIAEEIKDVGRTELDSVRSHVIQALIHLIKAMSAPTAQPLGHWLGEHRGEAGLRYTRAMRHRVDMDDLWRYALGRAEAALSRFGASTAQLPSSCLFTLEHLIDRSMTAPALVARLLPREGEAAPP